MFQTLKSDGTVCCASHDPTNFCARCRANAMPSADAWRTLLSSVPPPPSLIEAFRGNRTAPVHLTKPVVTVAANGVPQARSIVEAFKSRSDAASTPKPAPRSASASHGVPEPVSIVEHFRKDK